jgi:hypothetical protein
MKLLHLFNYCFKHKQGKMNWKNGRPKGTVKAVWQKTGMAIKKKKKKNINVLNLCILLIYVLFQTVILRVKLKLCTMN